MSKQETGPSVPHAHEKGARPPPSKPDPEWEEMKRMLERIADEPDEFETADVSIAAGHMKAAHAEGPITLHDGVETQPPEARVIIGEAILPTKVLSHPPGESRDPLGRRGRGMLLGASALVAILAALALTYAISRDKNGSGTISPKSDIGSAGSALAPSTLASSRTTQSLPPPERTTAPSTTSPTTTTALPPSALPPVVPSAASPASLASSAIPPPIRNAPAAPGGVAAPSRAARQPGGGHRTVAAPPSPVSSHSPSTAAPPTVPPPSPTTPSADFLPRNF